MKKRILLLLFALSLLWLCPSLAASSAQSVLYEGAAPYPLHEECLDEDGLGYHDSSLSVRARTIRMFETDICVVDIAIQDGSQLRTGLATKKFPSKLTRSVADMAVENNAVIAVNGDYFSYRSKGVVKRNGKTLRSSPDPAFDMLMINRQGDFIILTDPTKASFEPYQDDPEIVQIFSFGPYLIKDGVKRAEMPDPYKKISIDASRGHVRVCIGQTAPLHYVVFACEARDGGHSDSDGLNIMQCADVAEALGCQNAYNLDGGNSAWIWLGGKQLNTPWKEGKKVRPVSDIIYFSTLVPTAQEDEP